MKTVKPYVTYSISKFHLLFIYFSYLFCPKKYIKEENYVFTRSFYICTKISLYNYFMVSMSGWPDPNTRESCKSQEKCAKHEPKASDFARFS